MLRKESFVAVKSDEDYKNQKWNRRELDWSINSKSRGRLKEDARFYNEILSREAFNRRNTLFFDQTCVERTHLDIYSTV